MRLDAMLMPAAAAYTKVVYYYFYYYSSYNNVRTRTLHQVYTYILDWIEEAMYRAAAAASRFSCQNIYTRRPS